MVNKNLFEKGTISSSAPFPQDRFFYFQADGYNYLFGRDSLSVVRLPDIANKKSLENVSKLFSKLEKESEYADRPSLRTIALNLTNNCNFSCRYCFANNGNYGKPGLVMSFATAKKAINLLFAEVERSNSSRAAIAFFGGEPLLAWEMIKKVVKYAKNKAPNGPNVKFLITTNASMLTKERAFFMKENKFSVMVSIDGDKQANDLNRVDKKNQGTYDGVAKNISLANRIIPLTLRATITNNNLDLVKITRHFLGLGAKMITLGLDNNNLESHSYKKIAEFYNDLSEMYYHDLCSGYFYEITNFSQIFFQLLFKEKKISHCNAGLSYLGVAADGSMYKCPRFTDMEGHQFANIKDGKEVRNKIASFRQELRKDARFRNSHCRRCPFVFLCGGLCHYDLLQKGKNIYQVIPEQCELRKRIYEDVIKLYSRLPKDIKRKLFLTITDLGDN